MQGRCERHLFESAIDVCGNCLEEFCGDCVVYPFGLREPSLCMSCAVAASGVRARSAPPKPSRARRRKALRRRSELRQLTR